MFLCIQTCRFSCYRHNQTPLPLLSPPSPWHYWVQELQLQGRVWKHQLVRGHANVHREWFWPSEHHWCLPPSFPYCACQQIGCPSLDRPLQSRRMCVYSVNDAFIFTHSISTNASRFVVFALGSAGECYWIFIWIFWIHFYALILWLLSAVLKMISLIFWRSSIINVTI